MTKGMIYTDKARYVNSLNATLAPLTDFDKVQYARSVKAGDEYIKIADKLGGAAFIDVTGDSEEELLKKIAQIILGQIPDGTVISRERKRKIAPLFL